MKTLRSMFYMRQNLSMRFKVCACVHILLRPYLYVTLYGHLDLGVTKAYMYNRPMCGRSIGAYTNLGDLQRDLRGLSPTPPNKNKY
jgi:hypothetical protein